MGLATIAGTIALFRMLQDILFGKTEDGFECRRLTARFIAQHRVHRRRVHDLARVEDAFGIPTGFDLPEKPIVLFTYHLPDKFAAQPSVAMFPAERAFVSFYQGGDLLRDLAEQLIAFDGLQVNDRAQVKLAAAGMGIMHRVEFMFFQYLVKIPDIG